MPAYFDKRSGCGKSSPVASRAYPLVERASREEHNNGTYEEHDSILDEGDSDPQSLEGMRIPSMTCDESSVCVPSVKEDPRADQRALLCNDDGRLSLLVLKPTLGVPDDDPPTTLETWSSRPPLTAGHVSVM